MEKLNFTPKYKELSRKLSKVRITKQFLSLLVDCGCLTAQDKSEILKSRNPANELLKRIKGNAEREYLLESELDKAIASCDYHPPNILGVVRDRLPGPHYQGNETHRSSIVSARGHNDKTLSRSKSTLHKKVKPVPKPDENIILIEEMKKKHKEIEETTKELCELILGKESAGDDSLDDLRRMCENIRGLKKDVVKKGGIDLDGMEEKELHDLVMKFLASSEKTFSQHYNKKYAEERRKIDEALIEREEDKKTIKSLNHKFKKATENIRDLEKKIKDLEREKSRLERFKNREKIDKMVGTDNFYQDNNSNYQDHDSDKDKDEGIENMELFCGSPIMCDSTEDYHNKSVMVEASHVRIMSASTGRYHRLDSEHGRVSRLSESLRSEQSFHTHFNEDFTSENSRSVNHYYYISKCVNLTINTQK